MKARVAEIFEMMPDGHDECSCSTCLRIIRKMERELQYLLEVTTKREILKHVPAEWKDWAYEVFK